MSGFAESEFLSADLCDKRLNSRLRKVVEAMMNSPMQSIQSACGGWAETIGAYRLLNHESVNVEAIVGPHRQAALERARACQCVALIQDTSELDYSSKTKLRGSGPLNYEARSGFFAHSQFLVSEEGLPLGVIEPGVYARGEDDGQKKDRHRPIEEKESYRWLEGYLRACELRVALPEVEVFSISDREGDIFEVFERWESLRQNGEPVAEWIIRATRDRVLMGCEEEVDAPSLFEKAAQGEELGIAEFVIKERVQQKKVSGKTQRVRRPAREVRQRIRAMRVQPRPPYRRDRKLRPVAFWVVLAEEIEPPKGVEPLRWVLLTSTPVNNLKQAQRVIRLYLMRWQIEVFFRVLKTGCRVEELQLREASAVFNAIALYMIVAWRILYLVHLGRECPDLPCTVVFDQAEWKSAVAVARLRQGKGKAKTPAPEPSLGEMIQMVARFGGYLGRKNDPPPGAQALWQGMMRVCNYAQAWEAFGRPKV